MPQEKPTDGEDVDDFLHRLFDEADERSEQALLLDDLRRRGALRISETSDVRVERITDPDGPGPEEVASRHAVLNMSSQIALAAHAALNGDPKLLQALSQQLPLLGAFLEQEGYTTDDMRGKVARPDEHIVVHSGGVIRDNVSLQQKPFRWVSDMQFQMAADDPGAPLIAHVPHPDELDQFHPAHQEQARSVARQIHANHARVGVVTDVSVYPVEYRDHRFASRNRRRVSKIVREEANPRRKTAVDIWLASMFRIEAIRAADGRRIVLSQPIINTVSVMRHTLSSHFGAFLGWRVPASDIPVTVTPPEAGAGQQQFFIETGWETAVLQPREDTDI